MTKQSELVKNIVRATVPRDVRNWLRSPAKTAEWLWDSVRFSFGNTRTLHFPSGHSIICHPHAYKVFYLAQIEDASQREEFRNFELHCSDKMVLFDVGAHYGVFSLAAAQVGGTAIAVDPSPTALEMIAIESVLNGCGDRVQLLQAAVSDTNGVMSMLSSGVFSAGYFKVVRDRSNRDLTKTQAVTIDQIVVNYGVPTHIKIDVEGHEAAVLRGAKETLSRYSPLLFLELHNEMIRSEGGDPGSSLDELAKLGYAPRRFDGKILSRSDILGQAIIRCLASRRNPGEYLATR